MSAGKRPFGVSLLYIGWDKHYGFQLYQSDPSGNYGGWKATCIGNNSSVCSRSVSLLIKVFVKNSLFIFAQCLPCHSHPVHQDQMEESLCGFLGSRPTQARGLFTLGPLPFGTMSHHLSVQ